MCSELSPWEVVCPSTWPGFCREATILKVMLFV